MENDREDQSNGERNQDDGNVQQALKGKHMEREVQERSRQGSTSKLQDFTRILRIGWLEMTSGERF